MADDRCPACDRSVDAVDNYCPACGVPLDSVVVIDPLAISVDTDEIVGSKRSRLASIAVPLLVIGLLVGGIAALVAGGDDDEPDATAELEPTPTATPVAAESSGSAAADEAGDPTPTATPAPVVLQGRGATVQQPNSPWRPLPTEATHLAVAWDRTVAFLDLATGEWTTRAVRSGVVADESFGGGTLAQYGTRAVIVPTDGNNGAAVVSLDGDPQSALPTSQADYIGAADGRAFFIDWSQSGPGVLELSPDGTTAWDDVIPAQAFPMSVNEIGEVVVVAGGAVFAVTPDDSRILARAVPIAGAAGGRLLVQSCADGFACTTSVLDTSSGELIPTELGRFARAELRRDGSILAYRDDGPAMARLDETGRYTIDDASLELEPLVTATDDGLRATASAGGVRIVDDAGLQWVQMDLAGLGCCPENVLAAFVTLEKLEVSG